MADKPKAAFLLALGAPKPREASEEPVEEPSSADEAGLVAAQDLMDALKTGDVKLVRNAMRTCCRAVMAGGEYGDEEG